MRWLVVILAVVLACRKPTPTPAPAPPEPSPLPAPSAVVDHAGPVRSEKVIVPNDLPAFAIRGARVHRTAMVFVPGMCVHPEGYAMSFAHAAAEHGDLIAVQADVACGPGSPFRRWSNDLDAMDRRIDAAFRAADLEIPNAIALIGYSQGAERAEKLMARWPAKYTSAILIASPTTPSPQLLGRARSIALMAGTNDGAFPMMREAVGPLRRANVHSAFFSLPNARHGQMGDHPDDSLREALDFIDEASATETGAR